MEPTLRDRLKLWWYRFNDRHEDGSRHRWEKHEPENRRH